MQVRALVLGFAAAITVLGVHAQDQGCQVANAFLGALGGRLPSVPCNTAGGNQAPTQHQRRTGPNLDQMTPAARAELDARERDKEAAVSGGIRQSRFGPIQVPYVPLEQRNSSNWELVDPEDQLVAIAEYATKQKIRIARPEDPPENDPSCQREAAALANGNGALQKYIGDSCYRRLESSLDAWRASTSQIRAGARMKLENEDRRQREAEADRVRATQDEAAKRALYADLRSGRKQPQNCAQYLVAKGIDPDAAKAPVMRAAYQPPQGPGAFVGEVTQMSGDTLYLKAANTLLGPVGAPLSMVMIGRDTQIFNGENIRVGGAIEGFATQTSTRNVTLTNGSGTTVAVMKAICASGR